MKEKRARKIAVEAANSIAREGELLPVGKTFVGIMDGSYWVDGSGEMAAGLTKEQAIDTIVERLTH